jgi:hypothetical protein
MGLENYSGQIELIDPTVSLSLVMLSLMCMMLQTEAEHELEPGTRGEMEG